MSASKTSPRGCLGRARSRGRGSRRRSRQRGFTLIEAMISMVILSVGVMGIISMQTASVQALAVSQDMTNARNLAERMLEIVRLDAVRWRSTTELNTATKLLSKALPSVESVNTSGTWATIPDNVLLSSVGTKKLDRNFMPDTLGDWALGFLYCVHYRLTWVAPPIAMRADVRVSWSRRGGNQSVLSDCANATAALDTANVRSVSMSTTVMVAPP